MPHNHQYLIFDLDSIPEFEDLLGADLRFYVGSPAYSAADITYNSQHRLDLYEIVNDTDATPLTRLLDTRIIDPYEPGWQTFDMSTITERWRTDPPSNHGLLVEYVSPEGDIPEHSHVRLRRDTSSGSAQQDSGVTHQPLFVTYTHDRRLPRTKRRTKKRSRSANRRRKANNLCRRHSLYVQFEQVAWDDWIIAPDGYDAYFCHGQCQWPFPQGVNTTNHAIVQALLHSANAAAVPPPCCVPTEFSSLPLLFMDQGTLILKHYQEMAVLECGCR